MVEYNAFGNDVQRLGSVFSNFRLISVPFSFEDVFTDRVYEFITNKATALSTSVGYMVPCLLATTAFVTGLNGTTVSSSTDHKATLNLYSVVVGPPTTGKSQAMKQCAIEPLIAVRDNNKLRGLFTRLYNVGFA